MINIETYLNRITSEHKTKPKFMALAEARLKPFIDLCELLETLDSAFDLDTAVGKQLDIIGGYAGLKRQLNFQPYCTDAVLNDDYYRLLLKAKISLNNWDGTAEGVKKIWGNVFPDFQIQIADNQDMTMEARITGIESLFENELIQRSTVTPKPMGVKVDYFALFSITLDTSLYVNGINTSNKVKTMLPPPVPQKDNNKPFGKLYIGTIEKKRGLIKKLPRPDRPGDNFKAPANIYAGIAKVSEKKVSALKDNPPPDAMEAKEGTAYICGAATVMKRFIIPGTKL